MDTKKTGELLIESGCINQLQLDEALEEQKRTGVKLGKILIDRGCISPSTLGKVLENQSNIPYLHLAGEEIDKKTVGLWDENFIKTNKVLPYKIVANKIFVLSTFPINPFVLENIGYKTGMAVSLALTTDEEFLQLVNKLYNVKEKTAALEKAFVAEDIEKRTQIIKTLKDIEEGVPAVNLVNSILSDAINLGASDIHLDPEPGAYKIRYRIDGELRDITRIPDPALAEGIISRIKVNAGIDITEKRRPQDGHFAMEYQNSLFDFRIATIGSTYGEKMTIRVLNKKHLAYAFNRLGINKEQELVYRKIISKPYGLILISGPTGSGKTTTLYATLNLLNRQELSTVTIEDPVEYDLARTVQIQVNARAGITFEEGLKSILRLDPNIIMIGEIRDFATARIAIEAALTGHLVLASIHTNNACSVPVRLIELGIEPYLVSSTLIGAVSQRLVRNICPSCKKVYLPTSEELAFIAKNKPDYAKNTVFSKGEGCEQCEGSGYIGRSGIFEVLEISPSLQQLIEHKVSTEALVEAAEKENFIPLIDSALAKVLEGQTTIAEIRKSVKGK